MKRRRIYVPGTPVKVAVVISDAMKRVVVAVPHAGEVVMVFIGEEPTARIMTLEQAESFRLDLKEIHQAVSDDVVISKMEKFFSDGE